MNKDWEMEPTGVTGGSYGNAESKRRLTMCQPEILLSPFSVGTINLSALPALLQKCFLFFPLLKSIHNKCLWVSLHPRLSFTSAILFFIICQGMFHVLQSHCESRMHYNIKTFPSHKYLIFVIFVGRYCMHWEIAHMCRLLQQTFTCW